MLEQPSNRASLAEFHDYRDFTGFSSAVSLHAHTLHSHEVLDDLPRYLSQIPVVGRLLNRELRASFARAGCALDFSRAWWRPPLTPRAVFDSEAMQIERRFDLAPLVSITDHDDISAGLDLQKLYAPRRAPVSFE